MQIIQNFTHRLVHVTELKVVQNLHARKIHVAQFGYLPTRAGTHTTTHMEPTDEYKSGSFLLTYWAE